MGWESRNGRGRYYTRSRTVNGRVVREYVGTGPHAELAAAADERRRADRAARRAERKAEQGDWEAAEAPLRCLAQVVDLLARAHLALAGYHRHDRGEWRRKRRAHNPADP